MEPATNNNQTPAPEPSPAPPRTAATRKERLAVILAAFVVKWECLGWNRETLAEVLGVSSTAVQSWIAAQAYPDDTNREKIRKLLRIELDDRGPLANSIDDIPAPPFLPGRYAAACEEGLAAVKPYLGPVKALSAEHRASVIASVAERERPYVKKLLELVLAMEVKG